MYRRNDPNQLSFEDFHLPFGGKLRSDNRWVILAKQIPWSEVEKEYVVHFSEDDMGSPAKSSRMAFGALILKERLRVTDRELVEQISENPYLQYFLGLSTYQDSAPFHDSMLTHFRKRFSQKSLELINESIALAARAMEETREQSEETPESDQEGPPPKGKLIVDATCPPADIKYPTDLNLLNEAREKTEEIIDRMHTFRAKPAKKPRTYRQKARKAYLLVSKARQPGRKKMRKGIGKQLGYVKRNLRSISKMGQEGLLPHLKPNQYRHLLIINELYRQQLWMHLFKVHRVDHRIVSIAQPHVRPIVRGKAGAKVEFGAKVSLSLIDGISFVDRISWDAYNESSDLKTQIERYRKRFGHYPESVHADQIYRTRANRRYCKDKGIRLSGKALGRPKKLTDENAAELTAHKKLLRQDELDRIAIEGKFGQGKRRFGLSRIMAKLAATSETMIMISFMVMNLEKMLTKALYFCLHLRSTLLNLLKKAFSRLREPYRVPIWWRLN
ncbi:MAG: IS5 family transposase [bacterium]